jgi:hypothetical protein
LDAPYFVFGRCWEGARGDDKDECATGKEGYDDEGARGEYENDGVVTSGICGFVQIRFTDLDCGQLFFATKMNKHTNTRTES